MFFFTDPRLNALAAANYHSFFEWFLLRNELAALHPHVQQYKEFKLLTSSMTHAYQLIQLLRWAEASQTLKEAREQYLPQLKTWSRWYQGVTTNTVQEYIPNNVAADVSSAAPAVEVVIPKKEQTSVAQRNSRSIQRTVEIERQEQLKHSPQEECITLLQSITALLQFNPDILDNNNNDFDRRLNDANQLYQDKHFNYARDEFAVILQEIESHMQSVKARDKSINLAVIPTNLQLSNSSEIQASSRRRKNNKNNPEQKTETRVFVNNQLTMFSEKKQHKNVNAVALPNYLLSMPVMLGVLLLLYMLYENATNSSAIHTNNFKNIN